tara:strand:- start:718 stop:1647 length:930 start_codon:yes stop_codon:yes gene_type:complete
MDIEKNDSVKIDSFDIDEIDLKSLFRVLWDSKVVIAFITSVFAIFSVFYSLSLNDIYKSEATLFIEGSSNDLSLGGLSGLASIAGINVPAGNVDKKQLTIETLQSRAFFKHLITFDDILPSLVAAESYDKESKKIIFNTDIYNEDEKKWIGVSEKNTGKPTYLQAYDTYLSGISIDDSKFLKISVEHVSPVFAKELLDLIIRETNELLRSKDLLESSQAIEFLTTEVAKSSLISMRDSINELVHSKLEMQMMAKISNEYILKTIEPPFIPELKSGPSRAMICISYTFAGGIFAVLFVFIRHYNFRLAEK